jgi:hypothetical protein
LIGLGSDFADIDIADAKLRFLANFLLPPFGL